MPKLLTANTGDSVTYKKPTGRSVAYPAFTINYSKEFTQTIYSHFGGNSFNTRETIAKILKKSAEVLKAPISACVQYGLLEMRSKVRYKPTSRFMDLYKQDDQKIYRETMLACLREPELYTTLLDAYRNDIVPALPVLANNLFKRHKILENVSEKVASVFLQNLEDLSLIDNERKLLDPESVSIEQNIDKPQAVESEPESELDKAYAALAKGKIPAHLQTQVDDPELFIIEVPLIDNRKAKILCPMDYTTKDLKKIIKVIEAYIDEE